MNIGKIEPAIFSDGGKWVEVVIDDNDLLELAVDSGDPYASGVATLSRKEALELVKLLLEGLEYLP